MKRLKCKEIHESSWCPAVLRDGITDFLGFFTVHSRFYDSLLQKLLFSSGRKIDIVNDCAGSGWYDWALFSRFRQQIGSYKVTDLYPSSRWKELKVSVGKDIDFVSESMDIKKSIKTFPGVHIMFSALHHFEADEIREMITAAIENKRELLICDYSQRRMFIELLPLLLSPLMFLLLSPLVYPFSWRRLLFTYVIPILPLIFLVDSAISRMKAYTLGELQEIIHGIETDDDIKIECGVEKRYFNVINIHWILLKKQKPNKGEKNEQ